MKMGSGPTVLVSCGEASGDLYAGALARELTRLEPATRVAGFGGERLQAAGGDLLADYRGFAVTGLTEALRVLPQSFRLLRRLREWMRAEARRPGRNRLSRLQLPPRQGGARAGHPGRVHVARRSGPGGRAGSPR